MRRVRAHKAGVIGRTTGVDLSYPTPNVEASACLRFANANGGIEKMRETIKITPAQEKALHAMARRGEISHMVAWHAVEYRAQVLAEFDRLSSRERKSIEPLPSTPAANQTPAQDEIPHDPVPSAAAPTLGSSRWRELCT